MKYIIPLLLITSQLLSATLFETEPLVRVRVISTLDTLRLELAGDWTLLSNDEDSIVFIDGSKLQIVKHDSIMTLADSSSLITNESKRFIFSAVEDTGTMKIASVPYGVGWWWGGVEDRIYEGEINIYIDSSGDMSVTVHLPLESYLKGVVPYEIGGNSPLEALKAQAVAARSEAVIALTSAMYSGPQHDLTSDVECQVFSGNHRRTQASDQAVEETRGIVISEKGEVINAYYASNCGGHAELIENVWPVRFTAESYLVSFSDNKTRRGPKLNRNWRAKRWIKSSPKVYCNPVYESALPSWSQKNFRWSRDFTTEEITIMLTDDPTLGSLKKIKVLKRGLSGRIIQARCIFENGSFESQGELNIRQLFSPSLRSACFYVKKDKSGFTLHGAGWGHGVGMCQSGAIAQASHGRGFDQILQHYYPASVLLDIYE